MNPRQALDLHKELVARLSRPAYQEYMTNFQTDQHAKRNGPVILDHGTQQISGKAFCDTEINRLKVAETFFVSGDMQRLANFAALSLDSLDRFSREMWPADYGFLVFDEPEAFPDVWGRDQVIKAMSWGRKGPGMLVVGYSDFNDDRDALGYTARRTVADPEFGKALDPAVWGEYDLKRTQQRMAFMQELGRLQVHSIQYFGDDMRVGPEQIEPRDGYDQFRLGEMEHARPTRNLAREMLALMMMMRQTIVVSTKHDLKPTKAVHAKRMPIPAQVTVIMLRKAVSAEPRKDGETHVEWSHRWMVRGHWRNQYCGPNHHMAVEISPGQYRARLWVHPYVKGPEGAQLVFKEKVNALVR